MVLQILKLGYNVLMSDVDIYWFKNPLPLLSSFGPAVLVAQSDEYKLTGIYVFPFEGNYLFLLNPVIWSAKRVLPSFQFVCMVLTFESKETFESCPLKLKICKCTKMPFTLVVLNMPCIKLK